MKNIPENFQDLVKDETKAFVFLATTLNDGSPQVSPVWFNVEGEHIVINTARGRLKDINMSARPQVALSIPDPANPYRYILIRGVVDKVSEEGGYEHINKLSHIYKGEDFPKVPDQVRVIYKIKPQKVFTNG
ncbi:MAG: PPOX class F420-dependent oxidoreductase [Anaerolineales bacterium]|nr:PPOX class F420-dependent oxidoreductase [Anaerolineales bacterium]MCW5854769.1 PPOX class F420-dependent oxidoreductase [Anaerolineales bacterium]